jgi:hypothetical protein
MNPNPGASPTPDPILNPTPDHAEGAAGGDGQHPHNFDVQKELHQRIRNDPDYDDWEYGTEPLPHEAWALRQPPRASA